MAWGYRGPATSSTQDNKAVPHYDSLLDHSFELGNSLLDRHTATWDAALPLSLAPKMLFAVCPLVGLLGSCLGKPTGLQSAHQAVTVCTSNQIEYFSPKFVS